jgi:hypothetical protein
MTWMGFPDWTLWGMGLSALGTLLFLVLALIAQSPGFMKRTGLIGARLDLRVRSFTGFALAMLLLAIGFFLAGVPLESVPQTTAAGPVVPAATDPIPTSIPDVIEDSSPPTEQATTQATPATGAFGGPPPSATPTAEQTAAPEATNEEVVEETLAIESTTTAPPGPSPTPTVTAADPTNTPTVTPTPAPTETPLPTLTPTPIAGETAIVDAGGSTVWLHRSPGGQNIVTVGSGERVIVLGGHANQGGILWREVSTLNGTIGWIEEEFLVYES